MLPRARPGRRPGCRSRASRSRGARGRCVDALAERAQPVGGGCGPEGVGQPLLGGRCRGCVEGEHVGEYDGVGLCVREVEHPAEHVTDLVVQAGAGRREGHRGQVGAVEQLLARVEVGGVAGEHRESRRDGADALDRERAVDRVGPRRPHRVDAVRQGVEATGDAHLDRQRHGERGVVHDRAWEHRAIGAGALASVPGEAPHVGGLGAGVRRRHGDDRQAGGEGDGLGQPGRRAAADGDEGVHVVHASDATRVLGDRGRHVHRDPVVPHRDGKPVGDPVRHRLLGLGGDHHEPGDAEPVDLLGELCGRLPRGEADTLRQRLVHEPHLGPTVAPTASSGS